MGMQIRRLTRLTNAFSKKWENLEATITLHFAFYNFCRTHKTIRCTTPAMESGLTYHAWSSTGSDGDPLRVKLTLTHEEIGEMIGTTRETVSRLFSEFKKRQFVQLKGATLVIRNRDALEKMVHS